MWGRCAELIVDFGLGAATVWIALTTGSTALGLAAAGLTVLVIVGRELGRVPG
jgi:hypothetical protein